MKLIELVNDDTLIGFGIFTVEGHYYVRSLFGVFYNKEQKEVLLNIFFFQFTIG